MESTTFNRIGISLALNRQHDRWFAVEVTDRFHRFIAILDRRDVTQTNDLSAFVADDDVRKLSEAFCSCLLATIVSICLSPSIVPTGAIELAERMLVVSSSKLILRAASSPGLTRMRTA